MSLASVSSASVPFDAQSLQLMQGSQMRPLNSIKHASMDQIDALSKDFAGQFISQMLQSMFDTDDVKEGLGGSDTQETFQSMMVQEYGKTLAKTGGLGIADQIKRQMLKMQEVQS